MTLKEMSEAFKKHFDEEFIKFDRVTNKATNKADLHGFLILDRLDPESTSVLGSAGADEVFLHTSPDAVLDKITEVDIIDLLRCGISYNEGYESFYIFV